MEKDPFRVVVVGSNAIVWLTALTLEKAYSRQGVTVEVIELPSDYFLGDVTALHPSATALHSSIGLNEERLVKSAHGSFSLAERSVGFDSYPSFFMPYGAHGFSMADVDFHNLWSRARFDGAKVKYEDYSLNVIAAKRGRFFKPSSATDAIVECHYGLHISPLDYAKFLKSLAVFRGIPFKTGKCVRGTFIPENGFIESLVLDDGTVCRGDFFIDASGDHSALLDGVLGGPFESEPDKSPFDRMIRAAAGRFTRLVPYSTIQLSEGALLAITPDQNMTGVKLMFNSNEMTEQTALNVIHSSLKTSNAELLVLTKPVLRRAVRCAVKNCIAVGKAGGNLIPGDATQNYYDNLTLALIVDQIKDIRSAVGCLDNYCEVALRSFEHLRDFQILKGLRHGELSDAEPSNHVPASLVRLMRNFIESGQVPNASMEFIPAYQWFAALLAQGFIPRSLPPLSVSQSAAAIKSAMLAFLSEIKSQTEGMVSLDAYLELNFSEDVVKI